MFTFTAVKLSSLYRLSLSVYFHGYTMDERLTPLTQSYEVRIQVGGCMFRSIGDPKITPRWECESQTPFPSLIFSVEELDV